MATARARAVRHQIECMRNCLRGEAAGALLATVEQQVARLLGDRDDWDDYDDWPDPETRRRPGTEDASPAARAARRAAGAKSTAPINAGTSALTASTRASTTPTVHTRRPARRAEVSAVAASRPAA
jgi:hypothetical protein